MFVLIVALMSFSLIGIVTVQVYWISNAVEAKRKQFKNDVKISFASASEKINESEFSLFRSTFEPLLEDYRGKTSAEIRKLFYSRWIL